MNLAYKSCAVCGDPGATEVLFGVRLCVQCASEETGEGAHEEAGPTFWTYNDREAVLDEAESFLREADAKELQAQKARQAVKDSLR